MKYLGSKARIARYILPIMLEGRGPGQLYVEPFVGGCGSMMNVKGRRLGADVNPYLVAMYKALQDGWEPPRHLSEGEYATIAQYKHRYPAALVGFVGVGCSYAGKWFGGYARFGQEKILRLAKDKPSRDYCEESYFNLTEMLRQIEGVEFRCASYEQLEIPDGAIVYCDPPYEDTTGYGVKFEHKRFWSWASKLSRRCRVYVSSFHSWHGWREVWSRRIKNNVNNGVMVERLFARDE